MTFSKVVVVTALIASFCATLANGQHCQNLKLSASCDDENSGSNNFPTGPSTRGLPGKRGPVGEKGSAGQKGEPGDGLASEIQKLNKKFTKLQATSNATSQSLEVCQGKVSKLETELQAIKAAMEKLSSSLGRRFEITLTPTAGSFEEVREMCRSKGGDLLQNTLTRYVDGFSYQNEIAQFVAMSLNPGAIWIGLSDREVEGTWKYVNGGIFNGHKSDGNDLLYYWAPGQPQNAEDCGGIQLSSKTIHDYTCSDKKFGLCETAMTIFV